MIAIAQTVAQPFPLLQLTLKITLLLGLFFAFWLMFRKKSASFRHSILVVALLSIPCLLAAQWLIPSQNLQWLEQESVSNFERAFDYSPENSSANSKLVAQTETKLANKDTTATSHPETLESLENPSGAASLVGSAPPDGVASDPSNQTPDVSFFSFKKILLLIWFFGFVALTLRFMIAWLIVWRIVIRSPKLETDPLESELQQLIARFTTSTCKFRVHRELGQMPMCFGIFRYTILLPREFLDWDFADQKSVVLHESAHAYRRDCLVNFMAHLENAILWFHPLSWTLLRCLKSESEMACDDWAIARGVDNVNYASALFDVTMSTWRKPAVAVVSVSMSDCSPLERRMQSILSTSAPRKPISFYGQIGIAIISMIAVIGLAGFHIGSAVAEQSTAETAMKIEHRILLKDNSLVRGKLTGEMEIETSYGSARLDLEKVRSVKSVAEGKFEIRADDGSVLTGTIAQNQLLIENDDVEHININELSKIITIGNAKLKEGELTSGFLKDNISYHIRAPKGYDPAQPYPAIVFFHRSNSNTDSMLLEFVAQSPEVAGRFLLIGINGEKRSKKVKGGFNYTYIDFAGRSRYGGFPGTDRQSPALVVEAITELKDRIPISQTFIIGEGDGAFLAFSVMMNYAEMIDGLIAIDGGLLVQSAPDAYEDKDLMTAQRATPLVILDTKPRKDERSSYSMVANKAFKEANWSSLKFHQVKDKAALPKIYQRSLKSFEKKD